MIQDGLHNNYEIKSTFILLRNKYKQGKQGVSLNL